MIALMRFLIVISFLLAFGCSNGGPQKSSPSAKSQVGENLKVAALELSIQGMTCTGCEQTIQSALGSLKGVKQVKANYRNGKAYVEFVPAIGDTIRMSESITSSGYALASIKSIPLDSLRLNQ